MEERLLHASKLRLLRFYIWAVSGFALANAAAILVPLFVLGEPGQEDLAVLVVSLLLDVVKWAFLAALCYIFRCAISRLGLGPGVPGSAGWVAAAGRGQMGVPGRALLHLPVRHVRVGLG